MDEPRQYTREEVRQMFLEHCKSIVHYWRNVSGFSVSEAMDGVAFSILVALDGGSDLPGLAVIPIPHDSDEEYLRDEGENWFPPWRDDDPLINDISGGLHEDWHKISTSTSPLEELQMEIVRLKQQLSRI
jgi:hypothetical protein